MPRNRLYQTPTAQAERLAENLAKGIRVSPEDIELLERHNWHVDKHGYAATGIDYKLTKLHQLIFERVTGSKPPMNGTRRHIVADTKLDCRRENILFIVNSPTIESN